VQYVKLQVWTSRDPSGKDEMVTSTEKDVGVHRSHTPPEILGEERAAFIVESLDHRRPGGSSGAKWSR
jgi:hypothetical protein